MQVPAFVANHLRRVAQRFRVRPQSVEIPPTRTMSPIHVDSNSAGATQPDVQLRFVKLTPNAFAPTRGSEKAAGLDLQSAQDSVVPAGGRAVIQTDLAVSVPPGTYGRVAPRSGLAVKHFIDVGAGVIDEDYRGNVGVVLFNHGPAAFEVKKGDRIAQLICERIVQPQLVEVESLETTERGAGGFGSTGTN